MPGPLDIKQLIAQMMGGRPAYPTVPYGNDDLPFIPQSMIEPPGSGLSAGVVGEGGNIPGPKKIYKEGKATLGYRKEF